MFHMLFFIKRYKIYLVELQLRAEVWPSETAQVSHVAPWEN